MFINKNDPSNRLWGALEYRQQANFPVQAFVRACQNYLDHDSPGYVQGEGGAMVRFDPSSFIGELGLPRLCDYHIGDVVRLLTGEDISFHEDDGMAYVAAYLFTKLCGNTRHKAFYHDAVFRMTTDPDGLVMKVSQGASDLHHHLALVIRTSGDYAIRVCSQQEDNHDVSRTGMWKRGEYSGAMVKISNIDPAKPWGLRLGLFLEHVTSGTPA